MHIFNHSTETPQSFWFASYLNMKVIYQDKYSFILEQGMTNVLPKSEIETLKRTSEFTYNEFPFNEFSDITNKVKTTLIYPSLNH